MIRYGDQKSIPELKRLWKECFSDEDAYINAFFEAVYEDENVLLAEESGMLIGASFFLPGKIYIEEKNADWDGQAAGSWQDIRYVYALAVYPKFRGRGTAGTLLRHARHIYHTPLIAEPAEEGLVSGFYEPLGFSASFYLEKRQLEIKAPRYNMQAAEIRPLDSVVNAGAEIYLEPDKDSDRHSDKDADKDAAQTAHTAYLAHVQINPVNAADYCRIREAHFKGHGFVSWPQRHAAFAIQQHTADGGEALALACGEREDILLYYVEDKKAVVTETTLPAEYAAAVLAVRLPPSCRSMEIRNETRVPAQPAPDSCRLMGMIYGMPPVYGYLNLSLD